MEARPKPPVPPRPSPCMLQGKTADDSTLIASLEGASETADVAVVLPCNPQSGDTANVDTLIKPTKSIEQGEQPTKPQTDKPYSVFTKKPSASILAYVLLTLMLPGAIFVSL